MTGLTTFTLAAQLLLPLVATHAADIHVATSGDDAGTYRERINPPRGGTSDDRRITYQAAAATRSQSKARRSSQTG